jgi:Holliday junction resolvase
MSRKGKGIKAERELLHLFWKHGWACIRVAGSGAIRYPTPDLLAGGAGRVLAIECKSCKGDYQYLDHEEVSNLQQFATLFGAEAWVAVRFNNQKWQFLRCEALTKTASSYVVNRRTEALSFDALIGAIQISREP